MPTLDLTPVFRSSVGFDRMNQLFEAAMRIDEAAPSYPPYNIEKLGDNSYRITMAVAGFQDEDLSVTTQENTLLVRGRISKADKDETIQVLHRGIAQRSFDRRFQLADHIKVLGAEIDHGLLHIELVREVPEALRPREIAIKSRSAVTKPVAPTIKAPADEADRPSMTGTEIA